jgi:sulfite exporter TauE/SafE
VIYKLLAVIIATSSGSLHCGAMCGGLSLAAGRGLRSQFLYQGARLTSYATFGFFSGWAGERLMDPGSLEILAILSGIVLSGWLVLSGVHLLLKGRPLEWGGGAFGIPLRLMQSRSLGAGREWVRAVSFGALTPLLPCGWLMTALILSANSGSAWTGVLIFASVWAGSLPVLVVGPSLFRAVSPWLQSRGRKGIAWIMVLAGLLSIHQRLQNATGGGLTSNAGAVCHPAPRR